MKNIETSLKSIKLGEKIKLPVTQLKFGNREIRE